LYESFETLVIRYPETKFNRLEWICVSFKIHARTKGSSTIDGVDEFFESATDFVIGVAILLENIRERILHDKTFKYISGSIIRLMRFRYIIFKEP
jgi:hypothetical protein